MENQKYMDHLYCHPNETNKNYTWNNNKKHNNRSNGINNNSNNINNSNEFLTKENKQLKSMLILHLDLIQQQSEKLGIKERELATRDDESTALRLCIEQLETQVAELQKQIKKQFKCAVMERTSVPPPPLAKIKCVHDNLKGTTKTLSVATPDISFSKVTLKPVHSSSNLPAADPLKSDDNIIFGDVKKNILHDVKTLHSTVKNQVLNIIENNNNTNRIILDNKIVKSPLVSDGTKDKNKCDQQNLSTENYKNCELRKSEENKLNTSKNCKSLNQNIIKNDSDEIKILKEINEQKPFVLTKQEHNNAYSTISSVPSSPCSSPARIPARTINHKKKRRLWYRPDLAHDDDESMECFEFTTDIETRSRSTRSVTPSNLFEKLDYIGSSESSIDCGQKSDSKSSSPSSLHSCSSCLNSLTCNIRLNSDGLIYCIAKSPYHSRTWLEEELDGELEEEEARALRALEPKLEIPKWTEHEIIPCYSIEGTEDLSDDIFLKRHSKQEIDEKRRKKWDVQQIREQRRIEKLRRRHCKDELIQGPVIQSFFPLPEDLESICYMDSLPLQAFGESIPKLPNNGEGFALPWLIEADNTTRRMLPPKQLFNDFFKYGNKRTPKVAKLEGNYLEEDNADLKTISLEVDINMTEEKEQSETLVPSMCNEKDSSEISKKELEISGNSVDTTPTKTIEKSLENDVNITTALLPYISRNCYSTPMVMLAQHTRSCPSKTQMRKRLKYSSYIFITKRKRQQSMSVFVETANKLSFKKNSNGNLSGAQETQIETKILETTESNQNIVKITTPTTAIIRTTTNEDEIASSQKDQ